MAGKIRVIINADWCKGCEICVDVCPKHILKMHDFVAIVDDEESCSDCMLCEQLCPDFAIEVHVPEKRKQTA